MEKVKKLPIIKFQCDGGGVTVERERGSYRKRTKADGMHYCIKCALGGRKRWVSFYEWCYLNLSKEKADGILLRWDYEMNIRNGIVLSPKDVGHGSAGSNRKGYWFKCLEHPEHESEQKNINSITSGKQSSIDCRQCNPIAMTRPDLVRFLVNIEDSLKYLPGMTMKIPMKCPECEYLKEMSPNCLSRRNSIACTRCSDGVSYPEKFMFNVLEQLGVSFKIQLSKTTFSWCGDVKYDFYINGLNDRKGVSLIKTQKNDGYKEQLARGNGVEHYIALNCSESSMQWIKNRILRSELPQLLKFKESDVDWVKSGREACSSFVKKACALWNSGVQNVTKIADEMKFGKCTITRYLKQGAKIGW